MTDFTGAEIATLMAVVRYALGESMTESYRKGEWTVNYQLSSAAFQILRSKTPPPPDPAQLSILDKPAS